MLNVKTIWGLCSRVSHLVAHSRHPPVKVRHVFIEHGKSTNNFCISLRKSTQLVVRSSKSMSKNHENLYWAKEENVYASKKTDWTEKDIKLLTNKDEMVEMRVHEKPKRETQPPQVNLAVTVVCSGTFLCFFSPWSESQSSEV